MAATTTDRNTVQQAGDIRSIPVAAATTIYLGTLVATNATGGLVSASDSSALKFAGIAAEGVDNSAGLLAALYCKVYKGRIHELASSGLAVTDVGKPLYCADNQTVTLTPGNLLVGHLAEYKSATVAKVDISKAIYNEELEDPESLSDWPVEATTTIAAGDLVSANAAGYLIRSSTNTARKFIGVAAEAADNSGGAQGAINCQVRRRGVYNMTCSGLTQTDVGKLLYASAAQTVTLTPNHGPAVGVLEEFSSATVAPVRIDAQAMVGSGVGGNPGKVFTLTFVHTGAAIVATPLYAQQDFELPFRWRILRGYADARVAPGSTYVTTITVTDGTTSFTITITATATHGETETEQATPMLANTDCDVTLVSDNGSAATEDVKILLICEQL